MSTILPGVVTLDEGDMDTEDPAFHKATGRLLGDARETARLSQAAVAKRMGIAQSRIARLELGKRRLLYAEAVQFAQLYGVDISTFDPRGRSAHAVQPLAGRRKRIDGPRGPRRKPSAAD